MLKSPQMNKRKIAEPKETYCDNPDFLAALLFFFSPFGPTSGNPPLSVDHYNDFRGVVALISTNAYVFFLNLSWGPVMWVMLGEMFPNQLRGLGLAVSGLLTLGVSSDYPDLQVYSGDHLG